MQEFACSISRKDLQDLADLAMQVYRNPDELPFTYFRPIRDRLYSWGFDAIKDAQAVIGKCSGWIKTRFVHTYGFCWQEIWYRKEVLDGL